MRRDPHSRDLFERLERPSTFVPPPAPPWEEPEAGSLSEDQLDGFLGGAGTPCQTRGNPPAERNETRAGLEKLLRVM
jgi:hypothetical protein